VQPNAKSPIKADLQPAGAVLHSPVAPPETRAPAPAAPQARATAQIRFLAGLVVLLAAVCGALLAYTALR
jgi:hypothetical protein